MFRVGGIFSFENPRDSLMFDSTPVKGLMQDVACYSVTFDQCAFSLRLPGGAPREFCKKRTKVVANFRQIAALERACPGVSPTHTHVHALGSKRVKAPLGWQRISLAKAAGRYPARLCDSLARAFHGRCLHDPLLHRCLEVPEDGYADLSRHDTPPRGRAELGHGRDGRSGRACSSRSSAENV